MLLMISPLQSGILFKYKKPHLSSSTRQEDKIIVETNTKMDLNLEQL